MAAHLFDLALGARHFVHLVCELQAHLRLALLVKRGLRVLPSLPALDALVERLLRAHHRMQLHAVLLQGTKYARS